MKVLQVINNLATGGAEKLLLESIPRIKEAGIHVDLLLLNGEEHPFYKELLEKKCCTIYNLGKGNVYNPFLLFKIIPFLKKYDLVHVHLFPSSYWVALARFFSFSKAKLVFTEHSTSNQRRGSVFYGLIDRFIYKYYAQVVTISTEVRMLLKKHLKAKNIKFKTIHNGVDFQKFYDAKPVKKDQFVSKPEEKILIQVARFTREKDPETLIKAIPYVDTCVKLLLVGEGPEIEKMKELVNILEIDDKVKFLGIRTDVPSLLKIADIAVLSSNHEGQSLYGIEAMASGTPLVASNVSGLKTLVYGAGILFKHKDEIDLANQINLLLQDQEYYDHTINNCLKRAKKFGLDVMITKHIELYKELCQNVN